MKEHDPIAINLEEKTIPDSFLPSQLLPKAISQPEKALMLAIFQDAINTYKAYEGVQTQFAQKMRTDILEWVNSEDKSYLYAFEVICQYLNFEPTFVRANFTKLKRQTKPYVNRPKSITNKDQKVEYDRQLRFKRRYYV